MFVFFALIVVVAALVFVERKVRHWGARAALNLLLVFLAVAVAGSMAVGVGRTMEQNRFARVLPEIFEALHNSGEAVRDGQIVALRRQMGDTKTLEDIEAVADRLRLGEPADAGR